MPFVAAPNIAMVEILATKDGQLIENRFHVNMLGEPTPGSLGNLANVVQAWCVNEYADRLPQSVTITAIQVTSLHTQNAPQVIVPTTIVGVVAGASMPNEVTFCVSLRSAFIGRSARGRFYVLGVPQGSMATENRVSAGYRTAIQASVQQLLSDINATGFVPVIVSYITNNAPRPGGPVYFVIASATTTDDIVDSQRRRRPGIGA